jgi:hypothetical protein
LRHNLEENEQRAGKVVEVVVRISNISRGENLPIIAPWATVPFAETVREV